MATINMNTLEAKEQFSELVNRVVHNKDRIVLTRRGKEIAAIISLDDLKLLQESQDRHDVREAIESLKESRNTGAVPLQQLKDEVNV